MTLTSRRETQLLQAMIHAFRPSDCAISTEQATTRALQFLNTLDRLGSDRVEEIRKILGLNAAEVYGFDVPALRAIADEIGPTVEQIRGEA